MATNYNQDINWMGKVVEQPTVKSTTNIFTGPAFSVDSSTLEYPDGRQIRRDIVKHKPVVVMLVHDMTNDKYLVEREYRSGVNAVTGGLPAGYIDDGETPEQAAIREIAEETGVTFDKNDGQMCVCDVINTTNGCNAVNVNITDANMNVIDVNADAANPTVWIDRVGAVNTSEGFTSEQAHLFIIHLENIAMGEQHLDVDERISYAWVNFDEVLDMVNNGFIAGAHACNLIRQEHTERVMNEYATREIIREMHADDYC